MAKNLIKCPKDPLNHYRREVCEEVFRKNGVRYWCKSCELFKEEDKGLGKK